MSQPERSLTAKCVAEMLGTYLLVFFGCGAVHTAVLTGAQSGLWQVAIVWGVAIMVAVYVFGSISGAHINPAVTVALAAFGGFPGRLVLPYIGSQLVGAFLAAATLHSLYQPQITAYEKSRNLTRGEPGSEVTAMCYGEFFPAPDRANARIFREGDRAKLEELVPPRAALIAEFLGTMILSLVVFSVTNPRNTGGPPSGSAPVFIGLTVAILISVIAPLTQACFNPARDLGPRLFAMLAGWGKIALPGVNGIHFATVYLVAPTLGAVAGGGVHNWLYPPPSPAPERTP